MLDGGSNRAAERGLVGRGEDGNLGVNPGGQDRPIVSQLHNGLIVIFFFLVGIKTIIFKLSICAAFKNQLHSYYH